MTKRLFSALLGLMMVFGSVTGAYAASNNVKIHTISCGSGDATLIQYTEGSKTYNVLIDGGFATGTVRDTGEYASTGIDQYFKDPDSADDLSARLTAINDNVDGYFDTIKDALETDTSSDVITYLREIGLSKGSTIDYVINTHPHKDHVGGLCAVAAQYNVKNYILWSTGSYGTCTYTIFQKLVSEQTENAADIADSEKGTVTVSVPSAEAAATDDEGTDDDTSATDDTTTTDENPTDEETTVTYAINLPDGTVVNAQEGETVTLSVSGVHKDYKFNSFGVSYIEGTDDDKTVVTVLVNDDNTFTMPAHDVTVQANYTARKTGSAKKIATSGSENLRGKTFKLGLNGPVFTEMADTTESYRNSLYSKTTANQNNAWFNNQSLAYRMTYAGRSMITVGDLQRWGLQDLVDDYGSKLSSDIYKVVHHGHVNRDGGAEGHAGSYEFIKLVDPAISLCSSGHTDEYALGYSTRCDLGYSDIYATELYSSRSRECGDIITTITSGGAVSVNHDPSYGHGYDVTSSLGETKGHYNTTSLSYINTTSNVKLTANGDYTGKVRIAWKKVTKANDVKAKTSTSSFLTSGWTSGSSVTLSPTFTGTVYFRFTDSLGQQDLRKSDGFNITMPKVSVSYVSNGKTLRTSEVTKGTNVTASLKWSTDKYKAYGTKGAAFNAWTKTVDSSGNITFTAQFKKFTTGKAGKPTATGVKGKKVGFVAMSKKYTKADGSVRGFTWRYSTKKSMKKAKTKTTGLGKNTCTVTGLKKKKYYYVQVRYYYLDSTGNKVYGAWSKVRKIKAS